MGNCFSKKTRNRERNIVQEHDIIENFVEYQERMNDNVVPIIEDPPFESININAPVLNDPNINTPFGDVHVGFGNEPQIVNPQEQHDDVNIALIPPEHQDFNVEMIPQEAEPEDNEIEHAFVEDQPSNVNPTNEESSQAETSKISFGRCIRIIMKMPDTHMGYTSHTIQEEVDNNTEESHRKNIQPYLHRAFCYGLLVKYRVEDATYYNFKRQ